jgi:3-phenylpropionate/trans-cinnamate dioxygenase ferredoxin reductase subunit
VASTATRLGAEVTLIDPVAVPLESALGPEVARWLHGVHGVTAPRAARTGLRDEGSHAAATMEAGDRRVFDAVLFGVGMRPETSLAKSIGLEADAAVIVDAGQRTRNPAVLAVGDPTRRRVDGVLLARSEHWDAAQRDGVRAAASILGSPPPTDGVSWFWFDRHGAQVEAAGHMSVATSRVLRGSPGFGSFSVGGLRDDAVVAAVSVDDPTGGARRAPHHRSVDRGVRRRARRSKYRLAQIDWSVRSMSARVWPVATARRPT